MPQTYDSPQLNTLLGGATPAPAPAATTTNPKVTASAQSKSAYDSPQLNSLLGGSPAIAPVKPVDTGSMFPKSSKLVDPNSGDNSKLGIIKNTITGAPKAFWDFLGPGKIQDYLNTPEGQDAAFNLGYKDVAKSVMPAVTQFVGQPVADVAGVFTGPKTYKIPSIFGNTEITNIQKQVADTAQAGGNPWAVGASAIIKAAPQSIFDALMVVGVTEKVFSPRESVVATATKTNDLPSSESSGNQSFRLTKPPQVKSSPVPQDVITKLKTQVENQGGKFSPNYDPKLPTYWRTTPKGNGVIVGEVVQLKPSYFNVFKSKFGGDIGSVPPEGENVVYSKSTNLDEVRSNLSEPATPTVPKDLHPTLLAETMDHLNTHGEGATHVALQDNLGVTPEQADQTISAAKQKLAEQNLKNGLPQAPATQNETLNKILETGNPTPPKEEALTRSLEQTPESKKVSESPSVNFEYNPESGFVSTEPISKGIDNVTDFIKNTQRGTKAAKNLDDSLYTITKNAEADKILATKLTQKLKLTPEDAEAIYHYEEDKSITLSDEQQKVYDESIKPLAEASAKIAHKLKDVIPVDSEGYTPRFVKGRGNVIDRIKSGAQGIGGRGSVLGKNAPSLKKRTMKALVDEKGNRIVVSIKDGKVIRHEKGKASTVIRNSYVPNKEGTVEETALVGKDKNGKPYYRKTGKTYKITDATTKEIEGNTNLTYHKNAFVNRVVSYLNLRQVERATDFLEEYKASPEFASIGMKFGEGEAPKGWTTTVNPSFRGYLLDPHVAAVMDKFASSMMKGKDPLRALTGLNSFLRTAIFFNPFIHVPNIGVHWLVNRGTSKFINPKAYVRLGKTSVRAINAVIHQNNDYVQMLQSGAPLLYSSQSTRNMHNLLMDKMIDEVDKNPNLAFLKKSISALNPYVLSGKATWMINDIATMQAVYEEMANNKDITMEEAIKDVGAHIPNYRLPANKVIDLLTNPNVTMFGAYHYGALRSYYEMAKTFVSGNTPSMINESASARNKARRDVLDKLLMLGIIALVIYPAIDRALKKATGNPDAKMRRAGAVTFPYNIVQVATGKQDISQLIQSVMTPAVGTKELVSQMFNLDLFTGQHIRDTNASAGDQAKEALKHAEKSVAPVAQYQKLDTGSQSKAQFLESLIGISAPDAAKSKIANTVESAQTKVDKLDDAAVARVQETYDEAKALGFGTPEADKVVSELSSADYNIYKALKAVDVAKDQLKLVDKIEPIVREAHDLGFGTPEADALVKDLSEEELGAYKKIKQSLYTSTNEDATAPAPKEWTEQGLIDHLTTYAGAIGEHPVQLFNDLFAGNQSYRILGNENGQLMVARLDEKNSQNIKRQLGGATKEYKLDHTVPLEISGNNSDENLQLLSTDQWASNTKTENMLGKAFKAGTITAKEAREYIIRFKKGLGETMSPELEKEYKDKYGSKPLTSKEIQSIIDDNE